MYRVRRTIYPKRLGAFPVADPPVVDVLRTSHHLRLGDFALHDLSGVGLTPVLEGQLGPILEGLDEASAEADGHRATSQPLRL
jgi:hypothetical protein